MKAANDASPIARHGYRPLNQSRRSGAASELTAAAVAVVAAVVMTAMPLLLRPGFYYNDDFQTQFLPMFLEIARLLKSGELPFVTDRVWYGGAILGEFQYAVFNPVSLVLYLIVDRFDDLEAAAAVYALAHIAILSGGVYTLARVLAIGRREAIVASFVFSTTPWLIYWLASDWIAGMVTTAWLPWALAGVCACYRDQRWLVPAAVGVAMTLVSGWPFALLALLIACAVGLAVAAYDHRRVAPVLRSCLALAGGAALAAPALMPLVAYMEAGHRGITPNSSQWLASLDGLFTAGMPFFPDYWRTWRGEFDLLASPPMYYVSWFIPVMLVNADWRVLSMRSASIGRILFILTVALGLMCLTPANWQFKYAFRFLPYHQLALTLFTIWLMCAGETTERAQVWRLRRSIAAIGLPFGFALVSLPAIAPFQLFWLMVIAVAAMCTVVAARKSRALWLCALIGGQTVVFALVVAMSPSNAAIPNWHPPVLRSQFVAAEPVHRGRQLAFFSFANTELETHLNGVDQSAFWPEILPGNTALFGSAETINGYSAIRPAGIADAFCFDHISATCDDAYAQLSAADDRTGLNLLDLMAVDRVIVLPGHPAGEFRAPGPAWRQRHDAVTGSVFVRVGKPSRIAGNIVAAPAGLEVHVEEQRAAQETYLLTGRHDGGIVVLSRAWYPGFRATLNGEPLAVEPVRGLVPSVELPAGAVGRLTFSYWPANLSAGLTIAGIAAVLLGLLEVFAIFAMRRSRAPGSHQPG